MRKGRVGHHMHAKDNDRRVQGQKCVRCCCSCVKRRCDQVGASSAAPMRRLALGEGKSWVEDGAGWWGWGLLRGSQRDRGTIMITGHWWRTLKGQLRHAPHNNVGSSSHLVGGVMFCLRRLPAFGWTSIHNNNDIQLSRPQNNAQDALHRMCGNQTYKSKGRELAE